MRISDWSSDVCSSDLGALTGGEGGGSEQQQGRGESRHRAGQVAVAGRLAESLVIELVQLRQRRRVVEVRCFPVQDRVQALQVVGAGAKRGQAGRAALEDLAQVVEFLDRVQRELDNARAVARVAPYQDRESVVEGKSVSVRIDIGS